MDPFTLTLAAVASVAAKFIVQALKDHLISIESSGEELIVEIKTPEGNTTKVALRPNMSQAETASLMKQMKALNDADSDAQPDANTEAQIDTN